eukprot:Gb_15501 [translate_table: standard]
MMQKTYSKLLLHRDNYVSLIWTRNPRITRPKQIVYIEIHQLTSSTPFKCLRLSLHVAAFQCSDTPLPTRRQRTLEFRSNPCRFTAPLANGHVSKTGWKSANGSFPRHDAIRSLEAREVRGRLSDGLVRETFIRRKFSDSSSQQLKRLITGDSEQRMFDFRAPYACLQANKTCHKLTVRLSNSGQKVEMMRPRGRLAEESRSMKQIENFSPKGLKILVVDDDPLCLMVLERMLRQCDYNVTTCTRVSEAVSMVMENKDRFDLVMSDVYMPDEDGFRLLEIIGLSLDLPVISEMHALLIFTLGCVFYESPVCSVANSDHFNLVGQDSNLKGTHVMSGNGETSTVMKGITHGACDYLIKPVRIEELRNIWQHVVRRRGRDFLKEEYGETDHDNKLVESSESSSKKRKDAASNLEYSDEIIDDISSLKKSRVHWTVQLHQQFVVAVNQLGIDKAVPKKIIEIMGVQGLTRENVASHLQKYRLYLKRLSGSVPEPYPVASFQAAEDGKSGGTMQVQPGGKGMASSSGIKGLNLGAGVNPNTGFGMGRLDQATLKSLQQYRTCEQKLAANRAQVLGGIGMISSTQSNVGQLTKPKGGLHRMASVDLSLLWKAQRDQTANQKSGTSNILDDLAAQSFKKTVKLEDVKPELVSIAPTSLRKSSSRHSRARSMSNVLTNFQNTLPPANLRIAEPGKTMLKEINELNPMEGISWVGSTSGQKADKAITETNVDLFDSLVQEYGISSLSPAAGVPEQSFLQADFEAMSVVRPENEGLLSTAPSDISDYLLDDFLQQRRP